MDRISSFVEQLVSFRDPDLAGHHGRLGNDAHNFALHLGCSAEEARAFKQAAEIHDIGKMAIPEVILNKASRLTPAEMALVKQHAEIGHQIIFPLGLEQEVQDAVLLHHENYDGTGYPKGIGGTEIPQFARMLRICDSFDAITEDRPYHKGVQWGQALQILERDKKFYDPELLGEFTSMMRGLRGGGADFSHWR